MWSIRVLKDGAVPLGHSASRTHPIAHLALRKLRGNTAINNSSSGLCLLDPIVTMLTTAVRFPSALSHIFWIICFMVRVVVSMKWMFHACEYMCAFIYHVLFQSKEDIVVCSSLEIASYVFALLLTWQEHNTQANGIVCKCSASLDCHQPHT